MSYRIRKMTLEDYSEWASMREALWPSSIEDHKKEISNLSEDKDYFAFIALNGNGEKVGFLEASIRKFANGATRYPVLFLEGIWIAETERRNRLGQILVEKLEKWALENNFSEICSDAEIDNEVSIKAHKMWGFSETERVVYFRKDLGESR